MPRDHLDHTASPARGNRNAVLRIPPQLPSSVQALSLPGRAGTTGLGCLPPHGDGNSPAWLWAWGRALVQLSPGSGPPRPLCPAAAPARDAPCQKAGTLGRRPHRLPSPSSQRSCGCRAASTRGPLWLTFCGASPAPLVTDSARTTGSSQPSAGCLWIGEHVYIWSLTTPSCVDSPHLTHDGTWLGCQIIGTPLPPAES